MLKDYQGKQERARKQLAITKSCIIANCKRIIQMLEDEDGVSRYGTYNPASELFNKMHELRRDTINYERTFKY